MPTTASYSLVLTELGVSMLAMSAHALITGRRKRRRSKIVR
jgi:hypothetical protein